MGDRLGIPWGAAGFFSAPLPLKNPSADGRAAVPTRLPVARRHPLPGGNVQSSGKKKRLVESMAEISRSGSRLGAMASRCPTLRGSGRAANRPSPHPAMRAPPCFEDQTPLATARKSAGRWPLFGRKVPSRGAYVGVRTGRNGQWGAAPICVNEPHEISSPWAKVVAGHIFYFLRLGAPSVRDTPAAASGRT